jgi:DNA-binding FadR family transcriptional regulator
MGTGWTAFSLRAFELSFDKDRIHFADLVESRMDLEVHMARLAAERASTAQVRELGDLIDRMRRADGNTLLFKAADVRFHRVIADSTGNALHRQWLAPVIGVIADERLNVATFSPVRRRVIACHDSIREAIAGRDPEAAGMAMAAHIRQWVEDVCRAAELGLLPQVDVSGCERFFALT